MPEIRFRFSYRWSRPIGGDRFHARAADDNGPVALCGYRAIGDWIGDDVIPRNTCGGCSRAIASALDR